MPGGLEVAGANRHDMKRVRAPSARIMGERPEPSEQEPQGLCLDKGYDYDEVRAMVAAFGCTAHSTARGEEAKARQQEAGKRGRRWVVDAATAG